MFAGLFSTGKRIIDVYRRNMEIRVENNTFQNSEYEASFVVCFLFTVLF
jgi:hypothetical protein